jgi:hypothetical protein
MLGDLVLAHPLYALAAYVLWGIISGYIATD